MSEPTKKLLRTGDVAELLCVSKWTVGDLVRRGKLKAVKFARERRFRPVDVERFLSLSEEDAGSRKVRRRRRAAQTAGATTTAPEPAGS